MKPFAAALVVTAIVATGCTAQSPAHRAEKPLSATACPTQTCRVLKDVRVPSGAIACEVNGVVGPAMYSRSAPELKPAPSDLPTLRAIALHRPSPTLRFLYVGSRLLVFDARRGACGGGGIYNLINTRCLGYSPSDFETPQRGIVPGDTSGCGMTPPAWLPTPKLSPAPAV